MRMPTIHDDTVPPGAGARRDDLRRTGTAAAVLATVHTGRAGLAERIERHIAACRRHREPLAVLSVAIVRITTFDGTELPVQRGGSTEEEFGHRLRSRVRCTDEVLCSGDAEYGVILPNTGDDGARLVQERLEQALGGVYRIGEDLRIVHLRVGHAGYPAAGETGIAVLAAAIDARLA